MNKILFLQITDCLGGIERFIMNYAARSNSDNFTLGVLASGNNYILPDFWRENNIHVHLLPPRKNFFKYKKCLKKIIKEYDVIHINKNSLIDITAINIAKKLGKKVIVHSHNTSSSVKTKLIFLHYFHRRRVNKIADIKLACSGIAGKWLFGDNNFTIVPNGVDTDVFTIRQSGLKAKLLGNETCKVFGTVCRFTEQKNLLFLIDIFKELFEKDNCNRFILIGDGPIADQIKSRIQSYGLNEVCLLTGAVTDPQNYYQAIDYIISPSIFEGFPMSLVEAQACGKIVFASDSITEEIKVTDGVNFISLNKTAAEWADIIVNKVNNRNGINENSVREQFLLSPYNIKNTVSLLNKIYSGVSAED